MTTFIKKIISLPGLLKKKRENNINRARLIRIAKDTTKFKKGPALSGPRILFGPSFPVFHTLKLHDTLLSALLTAYGAQIAYLSNSYGLHTCLNCGGIAQEAELQPQRCVYCQRFERNDGDLVSLLQKYCTIFNFRDFVGSEEIKRLKKLTGELADANLQKFHYKNIPIGKYASDALRNAEYVNDLKLIPDLENKLRKLIFANLLYCRYFQEAIKSFRPDIILSHEAFYAPWVMLFDMARQANIPFYNYYPGMRNNTFFYTKDKIAFDLEDMSSLFAEWKDRDIAEKELQKIDLLTSARKKRVIYDVYFASTQNSSELVAYQEMLENKKPLAVMYTNVLWDIMSLNKELVFPTIEESYTQTLKFMANHKEFNLIIKPHPGDLYKGHESREQIASIIKKTFPVLPSNVLLLRPDTPVSTYELIEQSKVSIVHTTTVGLESVIMGKPTITLGKSHYRGQGFTSDPNNAAEFFSTLTKALTDGLKRDLKHESLQAKKYYYLLNYVYWHDFGIIQYNFAARSKATVIPRSLETLMQKSEFSTLARAIINKKDIPHFYGGLDL